MMTSFNHSWCQFYMDLADAFLPYQNDRRILIEKVRKSFDGLDVSIPALAMPGEEEDIDPFTIFALFNRGFKNEMRFSMMKALKEEFSVPVDVPNSVEGVPVMMMWQALFFDPKQKKDRDIDELWDLFSAAIELADHDEEDTRVVFAKCFDAVCQHHGIKWNITMGLYWVRPFRYLNLDSRNRIYMSYEKYVPAEIAVMIKESVKAGRVLQANEYLKLTDACTASLGSQVYTWDTFPELSEMAWLQTLENSKKWGHMEEPTEEELAGVNLSEYYPPTDKYDPDISSEEYEQVLRLMLRDRPRWLDILSLLDEIGGEATCKQLALKYGGSAGHYVNHGTNAAQYVYKQTGCSLFQDDDEKDRYWPVLFLGKDATDEPGTFIWRLRDSLRAAVKVLKAEGKMVMSAMDKTYNYPKNMILQGPPGTGKTYHTVLYAVAIIEGKDVDDISSEDYKDVKARYDAYMEAGQISFTTFHQSYGYEEFVEGIRPVMDEDGEADTDVKYQIEAGIFKKFCENAGVPAVGKGDTSDLGIRKDPVIWKVSLYGTGDNPIREECMLNGHIRIGWDDYGPHLADKEISEGRVVLNAFVNRMQIGDIILSCYSASTIDAIGVVAGDYEWDDSYDQLKRVRKVNWLVKDLRYNILEMNGGKAMTLSTVYKLGVSMEDVMHILKETKEDYNQDYADNNQKYVFIIDEINRGNISKIFGELITLIEPTKRRGQQEETKVILPYSKKEFTVPDNVYIVGTMNTADRSIALLDTALRRRFDFVEMQPKPALLHGVSVEGVDIEKMLDVMNQRIKVLYDREHTIGHSFFIKLKEEPSMEQLSHIFKFDIMPLLQEYFFDDYEKIMLVLGDNRKAEEDRFIQKDTGTLAELFGSDGDGLELGYHINEDAFERATSYQGIYETRING